VSWIEELGEKELSEKHVKLFVDLIAFTAEEEKTTEESVKATLVEYCDTAINNLNKIKKAAES